MTKSWSNTCQYGWQEGQSVNDLTCTSKVTHVIAGYCRKARMTLRTPCCDKHKDEMLEKAVLEDWEGRFQYGTVLNLHAGKPIGKDQ